jgi:dethiobiotin synthetase
MNYELRTKKPVKGFFITGTDTGVGKTYVGAGIAAALRSLGVDVGVMKPVETGCAVRGGKLVPSDALNLARAARCLDSLDLINPCRFRKPLAPSVAAALEKKKLDNRKILRAYRTMARRHELLIVEGAGGVMVPLTEKRLFLDLAADLGLPVLVVARPGLGTINHTLLTIAALTSRKIRIAGIVINYGRKQRAGLAEKTSPAVIEKISGVPVLGIVRHGQQDFSSLAKKVMGSSFY